MVVAAVLDRALAGLPSASTGMRLRRLVLGLVAGATIAVLAVEGLALQLEIADYRFYGDFHRRLCDGYAAIEPEISREQPLVLVQRGSFRGIEVVADAVRGCDKTFFVRRDALWQLVFLPPLANYMGRPFEERLELVDVEEGMSCRGLYRAVLR